MNVDIKTKMRKGTVTFGFPTVEWKRKDMSVSTVAKGPKRVQILHDVIGTNMGRGVDGVETESDR